MRPPIKGESAWRGILDPDGVHGRTITCIIDNINQADGFVTLDFDGLPSVGRPATIPWMWASFPTPGQGAWGRYMPFPRDVLKVSFDFDDTPQIVGYDTKAESPEIADGKTGWPKIKRANLSGTLPMFQPLQSGEFDFMSIGGAYIFGSASGQLMLTAGPAGIIVTKSTNLLRYEATQHLILSGTNKIRYGQVRRPLAGLPGEVAGNASLPNSLIAWNPDGSLSEFQIQVNRTVAGIGLPLTRFAIGSVTSDSGVQELGTNISGLRRFALEVYDSTGQTKVTTIEGDVQGSVAISAPTSPAFKIITPLAQFDIQATSLKVAAAQIELGAQSTGGAIEGATLGRQVQLAIQILSIATAAAKAADVAPTLAGGVMAALCTALDVFTTQLQGAINSSTSNTVKVQL